MAALTLSEQHERGRITVPMIANEAGVTPSTIYRRWGDVNEIFADISIERLRPRIAPRRTGSLRGDLTAWAQDYLEKISTPAGCAALQDVLMSDTSATSPAGSKMFQCAYFSRTQIDTILARWPGSHTVDTDSVIDHVLSPMVYRTLFEPTPFPQQRISELIDRVVR